MTFFLRTTIINELLLLFHLPISSHALSFGKQQQKKLQCTPTPTPGGEGGVNGNGNVDLPPSLNNFKTTLKTGTRKEAAQSIFNVYGTYLCPYGDDFEELYEKKNMSTTPENNQMSEKYKTGIVQLIQNYITVLCRRTKNKIVLQNDDILYCNPNPEKKEEDQESHGNKAGCCGKKDQDKQGNKQEDKQETEVLISEEISSTKELVKWVKENGSLSGESFIYAGKSLGCFGLTDDNIVDKIGISDEIKEMVNSITNGIRFIKTMVRSLLSGNLGCAYCEYVYNKKKKEACGKDKSNSKDKDSDSGSGSEEEEKEEEKDSKSFLNELIKTFEGMVKSFSSGHKKKDSEEKQEEEKKIPFFIDKQEHILNDFVYIGGIISKELSKSYADNKGFTVLVEGILKSLDLLTSVSRFVKF